jgi:hypothetical protein
MGALFLPEKTLSQPFRSGYSVGLGLPYEICSSIPFFPKDVKLPPPTRR